MVEVLERKPVLSRSIEHPDYVHTFHPSFQNQFERSRTLFQDSVLVRGGPSLVHLSGRAVSLFDRWANLALLFEMPKHHPGLENPYTETVEKFDAGKHTFRHMVSAGFYLFRPHQADLNRAIKNRVKRRKAFELLQKGVPNRQNKVVERVSALYETIMRHADLTLKAEQDLKSRRMTDELKAMYEQRLKVLHETVAGEHTLIRLLAAARLQTELEIANHFHRPDLVRIAQGALDFGPSVLAGCGLEDEAHHLENLAFRERYTDEYHEIMSRLAKLQPSIDRVKQLIKERLPRLLRDNGFLGAKVVIREKSAYSIWRKLIEKKDNYPTPLHMTDLLGLRIVLPTNKGKKGCKQVLELISENPEAVGMEESKLEIQDFVDNLKYKRKNGYRAYHANFSRMSDEQITELVKGKGGAVSTLPRLEVQIVHKGWDRNNTIGTANHPGYKYGEDYDPRPVLEKLGLAKLAPFVTVSARVGKNLSNVDVHPNSRVADVLVLHPQMRKLLISNHFAVQDDTTKRELALGDRVVSGMKIAMVAKGLLEPLMVQAQFDSLRDAFRRRYSFEILAGLEKTLEGSAS